MNRAQIEKLMDQYKQELLEFSRRNSLDTAYDAREQQQQRALEGEGYERDRTDPLPASCCAEESPATDAPEDPPAEDPPAETPPAVEAAATPVGLGEETLDLTSGTADIPALLRGICSKIEQDPDASDADRKKCSELYGFLDLNTETGTLRVEAFASDRAYAIENARVMIFLPLDSGNITVFDGLTNISGACVPVRLPAPPKALSMQPSETRVLPYATYTVFVEHPQFVRAVFTNVPVFSGIESIQPVQMLAKTIGPGDDGPIIVDQQRSNAL
ncbi:MAG: hypothetical protein IJK64_10995 [Clostridia bacterium]|nr:hypothetical protein [Clostridia bacterium]